MGLFGKLKIKKETDEVQAKEPVVLATKEVKTDKENVEKKISVKKTKKVITGNTTKVFVKPFISEKSAIAETGGVYTFVVQNKASKIDIKNAIKQVYGVEPKKVRVINMEGKIKRSGRTSGRRSDWKKAIITLPKGQTISIHEGV